MGRIDMTYDEVKRRMKNGATAQVIADLNGVTVQAVNAFIRRNKEAEAGVPEMLAPVETEQEQKKVESFKNENRVKWDREQMRLEADAERKGEAFTPVEYKEVSDADALAAVRAGWKSKLEKQFETIVLFVSKRKLFGVVFGVV